MRAFLDIVVGGQVKHRVELPDQHQKTVAVNRGGGQREGQLVFRRTGNRVQFRNESSLSCRLGSTVVAEAEMKAGDSLDTGRESFVLSIDHSDVEVVEPVATPSPQDVAPSDSDRHRQQRRISASHITTTPQATSTSGIMRKVSGIFGVGKTERTRLEQIEAERATIQLEAGVMLLKPGFGIGLPESAFTALLDGKSVTIKPLDIDRTALARLRDLRARITRLDAEAATLRATLAMPATASRSLPASSELRSSAKAEEERVYQQLDDVGTQDLGDAAAEAARNVPVKRIMPRHRS